MQTRRGDGLGNCQCLGSKSDAGSGFAGLTGWRLPTSDIAVVIIAPIAKWGIFFIQNLGIRGIVTHLALALSQAGGLKTKDRLQICRRPPTGRAASMRQIQLARGSSISGVATSSPRIRSFTTTPGQCVPGQDLLRLHSAADRADDVL